MHIEIIKYALKVWSSSILLSTILIMIGNLIFDLFKTETNVIFSDFAQLAFLVFVATLIYSIPFLIVFAVTTEYLKRKSNEPIIIKKILSGVCIFTILFLMSLDYERASVNEIVFSNLWPIITIVTAIVFIWIYELKTLPKKVDRDDVLDV